jgi:hypothetical protein
LCNDKSTQKNPTASSGTSIFVLSADILNHFVVKDIKIFTALNDFFAIASRNPIKAYRSVMHLYMLLYQFSEVSQHFTE